MRPAAQRLAYGALLLAALAGAYALGRRAHRGADRAAVEAPLEPAPPPQAPPRPEGTTYVGVVLARRAVDVPAPSPGRLESVSARIGEPVPASAVVARLETRRLSRDLAMAEAELEKSRADRHQAALEVELAGDRYRRLELLAQEEGLVSEQEVVAARYQEKVAVARLESAEATVQERQQRVAQLADSVSDAELKSPFDGVLAARYVNVGATVAAGERVLRIITSGKPLVRFAVPEPDRRSLAVGQAVSVRTEDGDLEFGAEISSIAPDVDPPSQMIFVEAAVREPLSEAALVGRVARVTLASSPEGSAAGRPPALASGP